jgi:hypothetical protein
VGGARAICQARHAGDGKGDRRFEMDIQDETRSQGNEAFENAKAGRDDAAARQAKSPPTSGILSLNKDLHCPAVRRNVLLPMQRPALVF